jgi:AcrR family transcriptional regulator
MSTKRAAVRRQPVQERGLRRMERILDAADAVIARIGYDAATTNAIARRARTAIGSLYQFFPNKESVLRALCERHFQRLHDIHERLFTPDLNRLPFADMFERIVDTLAAYHDDNPGFQSLFFGSATTPALAAAADRLRDECISRVDWLMSLRMPGVDAEVRRQLAAINVDTVRAVLPRAAAADPAQRETMLRELKRMMTIYAEDCWQRFGSRKEAGAEGSQAAPVMRPSCDGA